MRLKTKDTVGLVLVGGTLAALVAHNAPVGHRDSHVAPVVDAGGAVTFAVGQPMTAFYDVNVVPMDRDRVMDRQVVIVQGRLVTHLGPVGEIEVPEDAARIDGRGELYLAPGLTDGHVHLRDHAEALLPLFLANGVTTVLNLEGTRRHLDVRRRILEGELDGPTIYTAGPYIDSTLIRSPHDAERVVADQKNAGYDFLKVHGDLTEESFRALTRKSAQAGIAVVGHAQRSVPISTVLHSGQAAISHAEELIYTEFTKLDRSEIAEVADSMAQAGTWLTPGLVTFEAIASQWGSPDGLRAILEGNGARYLPASLRREWAESKEYVARDPAKRWQIARMLDFHEPLILTFHRAGVPLLAGTDAGIPGVVPGFSLYDEIAALSEVGLSSYEAMATATRNAGRFIGDHVDPDASFGVVREGVRADLILLSSDPRESLEALRRPLGVMARGRYYGEAELDEMLTGAGRRR